jgi:CHAT domain-containing protein/CHASE2 domain-containing sensor protein
MLPIQKKLQLIAIGVVCSLVSGMLAYFLFARLPEKWNLVKSLDFYCYNLFFKAKLEPPSNLLIIDSNDRTESRSRSEYATLIRQLHQAEAKCIAFDIRFLGNRDSLGDQELVNSVAECPEVILAIDFDSDVRPRPMEMMKAARLAVPDALCQSFLPSYVAPRGVDLPFDSLLSVAKHLGHINSYNKEYHHFPPVITYEGKCYAALPVEIAKQYFKPTDNSLPLTTQPSEGDGEALNSTNGRFLLTKLPLDRDGQILINFVPLEAFRPHYFLWEDAIQLLQYERDNFRGAVVLIVNSAIESMIPTPAGPYTSWALLASLTSQLLLNRHIDASDGFNPLVFSAILVFWSLMWLLFVAPRLDKKWRKTRVILVAGNAIAFLFIVLLLRYAQQWLGVVMPLFVFNTSMLVVRAKYYRMLVAPPQYADLGLAVSERQGRNYSLQVIESLVGEEQANASFQSFMEEETFQKILQRLKNLQASRADMKEMGEKLFDALFQSEIYSVFERNLDRATSAGKKLRLRLRLDAPELICLPWELIYNAKRGPGFILLDERLSLARYLPLAQPTGETAKSRMPLKILVLIASPSGLRPLDVKKERKLIKKSLRPLIWGGDIQIRFCEHATLDKLRTELRHKPDILHYIGHGRFDPDKNEAFLEFESETNEPNPVHAEALGNLLHRSSVKLVVLNTCEGAAASDADAFTGVAQNLVRVEVPAIVAMQFEIPDRSAVWFARIFYSTLITHNSIDAAVAEARKFLMANAGLEQQDWATPVLFMRTYSGKIFEVET